jgi:hypothetical protein
VWTTDGSYDRRRATDLSGMDWIMFCTRTGFRMTGMFWEKSPLASLFRAEKLSNMHSSPSHVGSDRFF